MAEVPRKPATGVLIFTAGALSLAASTAVNAGGVDGLADFSQESVGFEATPRHGVEMQRLLVHLDLLIEPDLRDRDEGFTRIAGSLGFHAEARMLTYGDGKSCFTRGAVLRRRGSRLGRVQVRNQAQPYVELAVVNLIRNVRRIDIPQVIDLVQAVTKSTGREI